MAHSSKEFYSLNNAEAQQTYVGVRRAKDWVGFFLPHLKPGDSVLKPGGIAAVSDDDMNTTTFSPDHPIPKKIVELWSKVVYFNGGSPFYSRNLRGVMLEAGFTRTEGFAVAAEHYGRLEETRRMAGVMSRQMSDPPGEFGCRAGLGNKRRK